MTMNHRERLRLIRTFPSLIKYLRDELDWPISGGDFEDLPPKAWVLGKTATKENGGAKAAVKENTTMSDILELLVQPLRYPFMVRGLLASMISGRLSGPFERRWMRSSPGP